jgi:hypothetical protein
MFSLRELIYSQSQQQEEDGDGDLQFGLGLSQELESEQQFESILLSANRHLSQPQQSQQQFSQGRPQRQVQQQRLLHTPIQEDDTALLAYLDAEAADLAADAAEEDGRGYLEAPKSSVLAALPFVNYRRQMKRKEKLPDMYLSSPQVTQFK